MTTPKSLLESYGHREIKIRQLLSEISAVKSEQDDIIKQLAPFADAEAFEFEGAVWVGDALFFYSYDYGKMSRFLPLQIVSESADFSELETLAEEE